jgi:hypothetical protein
MNEADKAHFARQLDELSRQSQTELYKMGSISADLMQARYMLDTIRNQVFELERAKAAVAGEILSVIAPSQVPPPLPRGEVDDFVGQIAERFRPVQDHPLDPYVSDWAYAQRRAAE